MRSITHRLSASVIAAALLVSPTMASASTTSVGAQPQNAWVALSQMTPAGAAALASTGVTAAAPDAATMATAAAAAQPVDGSAEPGANPLPLPVIAVLLAVLGTAIYIAFIEKHHGHVTVPTGPVSPS